MALQAPRMYKGVELTYWKIIKQEYSAIQNKTIVILAGYKDEATRRENINNFLVTTSSGLLEGNLTLADAYGQVKESVKDFANAADL